MRDKINLFKASDDDLIAIIAGCQEILASRIEKRAQAKEMMVLSKQENLDAFQAEIAKQDLKTLEIALDSLAKVGPNGTDFYSIKVGYIRGEIALRKANGGRRPYVRKRVKRQLV